MSHWLKKSNRKGAKFPAKLAKEIAFRWKSLRPLRGPLRLCGFILCTHMTLRIHPQQSF